MVREGGVPINVYKDLRSKILKKKKKRKKEKRFKD